MRVMVVEDEQRARQGLSNLIQSASRDCQVVSMVANGVKALEEINLTKPDVVFTDLRMPFMDGMTLIEAAQSFTNIPRFIIISAYEQFDTARKALALGVVDYLVKPVTLEDVQKALNRVSFKEGREEDLSRNLEISQDFPHASPHVINAIKLIEQSHAASITQESIADELGITKEYLSYLFHRDTGETFSNYLKRYRIGLAVKLFKEKQLNKADIAHHVGFTDPKYFSRVFKEITGMSLTSFERNC